MSEKLREIRASLTCKGFYSFKFKGENYKIKKEEGFYSVYRGNDELDGYDYWNLRELCEEYNLL